MERKKEMRKDIMAAGGEGGMQEGRDQDAAQPETEVRASVRNHQIGDNTQSNASLRGNICLYGKHMVDIRKKCHTQQRKTSVLILFKNEIRSEDGKHVFQTRLQR